MFGVTGTGLAVVKTWRNEGKRPRYSLDQWDRVCEYVPIIVVENLANFICSKVSFFTK